MSYTNTNYILLDAARMGADMETAKRLNSTFGSLYLGESEESLSAVAPYLFFCQEHSKFQKWVKENGWGNSWGTILHAMVPQSELQRHFRKFLIVKTYEKEEYYFRFYDPRVLKIFLPTCDKQQILEFFGPVKYFIVEGDTKKDAIKFWQENGVLKQQKLAVGELFEENEQVIQ